MKSIWLLGVLVLLAAMPAQARDYLKQERAQSRGFTPGVVTEGGKTVWVSGQTVLVDEQSQSMARKMTRACPSKFPAIDWPCSSISPVCPETQTVLPPSVTTPGEKPRDCARSCLR